MMRSSPVANPVCWGSIIAIPLNLTIPSTSQHVRDFDRAAPRQTSVRDRRFRHTWIQAELKHEPGIYRVFIQRLVPQPRRNDQSDRLISAGRTIRHRRVPRQRLHTPVLCLFVAICLMDKPEPRSDLVKHDDVRPPFFARRERFRHFLGRRHGFLNHFLVRSTPNIPGSRRDSSASSWGSVSLILLNLTIPPRGRDLPASRKPSPKSKRQDNTPSFEIRSPLFTLCGGVDLTALPGLGPYGALRLISEIGVDMRCWPTEHHVASWLTLAPNNKISGGKLLGSRTQPSANRAAKILRLAAMALVRGDHALGAFYRRLAARTDKPTAMTATARKLALLVYRMLKYNMPYHHTSAAEYDTRQRTRILRGLRKRATSLGFELVEASTGLVV